MRWRVSAHLAHDRSYQQTVEAPDLYAAVRKFADQFATLSGISRDVIPMIAVGEIVNLHNEDGLKHIPQIQAMMTQIAATNHIFEPSGIPNIKIFQATSGSWVLFDGHHSLLAYYALGYRTLADIPHLVIQSSRPDGRLRDAEIRAVFGPHAALAKNWRSWAINWQNPPEAQITPKRQHNIDELYASIKADLES